MVAALPILPIQRSASPPTSPNPRERLLLDFGWRFHFGHSSDPAKDFDFGRHETFAKSGEFVAIASPRYEDNDWQRVDLPHDWAVELPFENRSEEHTSELQSP